MITQLRTIKFSLLCSYFLMLAFLLITGAQLQADTFTVSNTNDSGIGSLRQAILDANANPGKDKIDFNISGAGTHTIQPTSKLPDISDPVVIDGYTQSGAKTNTNQVGQGLNTVLKIELDGGLLGGSVDGLPITAGNCEVRGLVINRFAAAILLLNKGSNVVQGNFLGTDVTGTQDRGNSGFGVIILDSPNNLVGGSKAAARNLLSGNDVDGVRIAFSTSTGNKVQGNLIGTDIAGNAALRNNNGGVFFDNASNNTIGGTAHGSANVISGNGASGVVFVGSGSTGNKVQGNYIGTDVTGTIDLGNSSGGVFISDASNNIIGGTTERAGNVVSGNDASGIVLSGSGTIGNKVLGNFIGTDVSGTMDLGNSHDGVHITSKSNTIGGTAAGAGNLISGNDDDGIEIRTSDGVQNLVQGNLIGTDVTGTLSLGNAQKGIRIRTNASDNVIGGTDLDAGNTIAFNGQDAVRIFSGTRNAILSNSMFSNTSQGIDLGSNGVTPNDPGDADTGANNLQNFPEIISSFIDGAGNWSLKYHVDSDPANSVYALTVQFFESDPNGQGRSLLFEDEFSVSDFSNGMKSLDLGKAADLGVFAGSTIVATATDVNGNTSEFSTISVVDTELTFVTFGEGRRTDFSDVTFDAYIDKHKADFNTGVTKFIRVGNDGQPNRRPNRSLIKFDFIDGLIMSGVTNASQIVKAELELYIFSSEDGGEEGLDVDIFRVMKDWNEGDTDYAAAKTGEVTWNAARHDEVEWARAGAGRVNKDREEDPDDTQFIESRGRATFRVTFNVTTTAKAIFDDAENYGWLLQAQDEGKDTYFRIYSSEHRKKRRRPKLTITAIVPSDGLAKSNLNDHGSVLRQDAPVPAIFGLSQNFPNPFNPETRIEFQLPNHSHVTIKIFNTLGQEIRTLVDAPYSSGYHSVRWNGTDRNGNQVASGVYIYKMTADDFHAVKKMSLLR